MSALYEYIQDGQHKANLIIEKIKDELKGMGHVEKETFVSELKTQFDKIK